MSNSVLQQLTIGGLIRIDGPNWTRRDPAEIRPSDFRSNILCQRHNSALADLDAAAGSLFHTASGYQQRLPSEVSATGEFALFDGETIERWMLKTLWGIVAAKTAQTQRNTRIDTLSPRLSAFNLSEHIFRGRPWPFEWGLHTSFLTGTAVQSSGSLVLNPYLDDNDQLVAIGLEFGGIGLRIGLAASTEPAPARRTQIRPAGIVLTNGLGSEKVIAFGWPGEYSMPLTLELASPRDHRKNWPTMRPSD